MGSPGELGDGPIGGGTLLQPGTGYEPAPLQLLQSAALSQDGEILPHHALAGGQFQGNSASGFNAGGFFSSEPVLQVDVGRQKRRGHPLGLGLGRCGGRGQENPEKYRYGKDSALHDGTSLT